MNDEDKKPIEKPKKPDFSTFFNSASVEAQRKLMEGVARKANADQRALLEQYERMKPKTT